MPIRRVQLIMNEQVICIHSLKKIVKPSSLLLEDCFRSRYYCRHYSLLLSMLNLWISHSNLCKTSVCKLARTFQTWSPFFLCLTGEKPFAQRDANMSTVVSPCIAVSRAIHYHQRGSWRALHALLHKQVMSSGNKIKCLCDQIFETRRNLAFFARSSAVLFSHLATFIPQFIVDHNSGSLYFWSNYTFISDTAKMSNENSKCDQIPAYGAFEEFEKARQGLHEHVSLWKMSTIIAVCVKLSRN